MPQAFRKWQQKKRASALFVSPPAPCGKPLASSFARDMARAGCERASRASAPRRRGARFGAAPLALSRRLRFRFAGLASRWCASPGRHRAPIAGSGADSPPDFDDPPRPRSPSPPGRARARIPRPATPRCRGALHEARRPASPFAVRPAAVPRRRVGSPRRRRCRPRAKTASPPAWLARPVCPRGLLSQVPPPLEATRSVTRRHGATVAAPAMLQGPWPARSAGVQPARPWDRAPAFG